ncbi:hypothetical protein DE146DRAFT_754359 [Phaeosphaeria sp. MPI-PUGE-AT-0046c]|nr:hypothetical protein DE146DRAFT_754359 [Phaeosphaeria sp. MPI-PUGE-AT-0046c]
MHALQARIAALEQRMTDFERALAGTSGATTGRGPRRSNREGRAPTSAVGSRENATWLPFTVEAIAAKYLNRVPGDRRQCAVPSPTTSTASATTIFDGAGCITALSSIAIKRAVLTILDAHRFTGRFIRTGIISWFTLLQAWAARTYPNWSTTSTLAPTSRTSSTSTVGLSASCPALESVQRKVNSGDDAQEEDEIRNDYDGYGRERGD